MFLINIFEIAVTTWTEAHVAGQQHHSECGLRSLISVQELRKHVLLISAHLCLIHLQLIKPYFEKQNSILSSYPLLKP